MTPAERVILRTLADEYRLGNRPNCALGPYGRTGRRLGVTAYRVWKLEEAVAAWPHALHPRLWGGVDQAAAIEARLA